MKAFSAPAQEGKTIVVEDDDGRVQCGVTSYVQASPREKQVAVAALSRLQQKSVQATAQQGVTEADIDRELQGLTVPPKNLEMPGEVTVWDRNV